MFHTPPKDHAHWDAKEKVYANMIHAYIEKGIETMMHHATFKVSATA